MATHEIPLDAYVGQPREWLLSRRAKLRDQIMKNGPGAIASTSDGGLSVSYRSVLATDELRAINYALNGNTEEDLNATGADTPRGRAPAGFVPGAFF